MKHSDAETRLKHPAHTLSPSVCPDTQVKVWMNKFGWTENEEGQIFVFNQEESVKPKNIVEKIDFESECCHTYRVQLSIMTFHPVFVVLTEKELM